MSEPVIQLLVARRIWDSRGRPTVEAEITLSDGAAGRGIAPAGASRGSREAIDKRDGGKRFGGFDVQDALQGIAAEIAPALAGLNPFDQAAIDARLVALDGTANKARLGGNALTAVSLGVLHAAAASRGLPLWLYCLGDKPAIFPLPEIQIFGGGAHAGRRTDVQDFMVIAPRAKTFAEALEVTAEVYHSAGAIMAERGLLQGVADEGGWWPAFSSNEEALETLMRAIERSGFVPGEDVAISLDVAASEFGQGGRYRLGLEQRELDRDALAEMLLGWCARYPILSIEDPFAEDDDKGFEQFAAAVGDRIQVIGDDYLVTSASRVTEAARRRSVNAVLIKVNQAGTVSEAKAACDEGRRSGFGTIVSARSGETEDTSIVHLAIGWGAGQLKVGSFARSERMAKWNEALRIEEGLGSKARFAGLDEMPMRRGGAKPVEPGVVGAVHSPSIDGRPSGRPLDRAGRAHRARLQWRSRLMATNLAIESGALAVPEPDASGVRVYKGIRYAAPPIGPLRWSPPEPVAAWTGVRPAHEFGGHSVQGVVWDDIDLNGAESSEDCLYLNVWTSAAPGTSARLPVMVWIHGGGFVVGSGAEPRYDGARLAARGIVVLTVNHRLNALGLLAHPELTAESDHHASGNYGMLDLVAALKWVKSNIAAFGGDPDKVTIAGESAGSQATSALMASPLAKGLFARVIGESGAMFASPSRAPAALAEAGAAGLDFMRKVGARSLAELRAAPADAILAAAPGLGFRPIIDGWFLPRSPAEIFAAGEQSDVPLMAGWNKDEGFNFTLHQGDDAKRAYVDLARAIFGERTEALLQHYPDGSPETDAASAHALGGDLVIIHPTWAWIEAQKQSGRADIFRFRFDRAPLTPQGWFGERDSRDAGAFHAGELLYVFDNLHAFPWLIDDADRALAKLASSYWINFVTNGDPNGPGLPRWPSYRGAGAPVMMLDSPPRAGPEEWRERHMFLKAATESSSKAGK